MSVYVVAMIRIEDRERYGRYEAAFPAIFLKSEGEVLAVDDAPQCIEGAWHHSRMVLLRFPDEERMRAWYESPEYQEIMKDRVAASKGDVFLVKSWVA